MLNDKIRTARMHHGLTLQQTADAIGVTMRSYQRYEAGTCLPPLDVLVKIADLFNVPTDWLLERYEYLESLGVSVDVPETNPPRHPRPQ